MSFYKKLFGRNPYSEVLLAVLGISADECGRFRDCYPNDEGTEIHVYTRNGGGNREEYQDTIDALATHPLYVRDFDDDYDCTYATIAFRVPDEAKALVAKIADQTDTTPPMDKFRKLISDLESHKDNAVTSRALGVGRKIMGAMESRTSADVQTTEGGVSIKSV